MPNSYLANLPYVDLMDTRDRVQGRVQEFQSMHLPHTALEYTVLLVACEGEIAVRKGIANYFPRVNFS